MAPHHTAVMTRGITGKAINCEMECVIVRAPASLPWFVRGKSGGDECLIYRIAQNGVLDVPKAEDFCETVSDLIKDFDVVLLLAAVRIERNFQRVDIEAVRSVEDSCARAF